MRGDVVVEEGKQEEEGREGGVLVVMEEARRKARGREEREGKKEAGLTGKAAIEVAEEKDAGNSVASGKSASRMCWG